MYSLWSFLLLGSLWICFVNCQDSVDYQNDTITVTEGENVALYCSFKLSGAFNGLRWYKVSPGSRPVHIINGVSTGNTTEGIFTLELQSRSCFLHIHHPAVSDSALYLCAVTGAARKLVFGGGTQLIVIPKTQKQTPYVYKLKLKSSESVNNLPNSVCLITDFPSPNKTLNIDGEVVDLNVMAVLDNSTNNVWRYSTVIWNNNNKDVTCNGTYDDNDFSDTGNTEETCSSSVSIDENFKTNPSLNTIPVTVLGLRILTAKAIVFNLIITARLWSY